MIVAGLDVADPDVEVVQGKPFPGLRPRERTTCLIVHETVTRSAAAAHRVLVKRGLSVQLVTDERGRIIQHADLASRCSHAGAKRNPLSIGNEVTNPYYPRHAKAPWGKVIDAPWAHEKRYVLPTPESAEACARWIDWQTSAMCPAVVRVPRVWAGLVGGYMSMGRVTAAPTSGILAHCYFGHADGAWLVLYAWLCLEAGLDPITAYVEATRRATGVRRVDLRDLA